MLRQDTNGSQKQKKMPLRFAVVGLGHIAQVAVLPAFAKAKRKAKLVALVSGDQEKLRVLGERYEVPHNLPYEEFDGLLESGEVDAVYIALPNSMHKSFTVAACRSGVHVLCEKPLAVTVADCEEMIRVADENHVFLMTAYRLHFEKANLAAVELVQSGRLGEPKYFSSNFSMQVKAGNIRVDRELGGGVLYDIGIYCINSVRNLFKAEPRRVLAVDATDSHDPRFSEVPMTISATLEFPNAKLAQFTASFGAADVSEYRIVGTKGSLRVEPAYSYAEDLAHELADESGSKKRRYPKRDQFAAELVYFADCVRNGTPPEPDGEEGLLDVRVIEACNESIRLGRPVELEPYQRHARAEPAQEISRPAAAEPPAPVHAESPH